ncbi:cyclin-I [Xenentodon cancila]
MKCAEPWGPQRLSFLLEKAVSREAEMWRVYMPKKPSSQDTDISPAQRDEAVRWLTELHSRLQLYPETLVLAVSILDRFLAPIKARPKYLRCIAITCFFLAAKICEEDECVPSLKELAGSSNCGCSPSEILRMERVILDKLQWDLHTTTALDFLHIFHAMVFSCRSGLLDTILGVNLSQHLALLTRRLYHCLADHTLTLLKGSMLALALITLELETCCPDWLALTIDLLRNLQMDCFELVRGQELVACSLSAKNSLRANTVYIYQPVRGHSPLQLPAQDPSLPRCTLGTITSSTESSRDHVLATATAAWPEASAEAEEWRSASCSSDSKTPTQRSATKQLCHRDPLLFTLRCKASAKRKVEQMDVDDFYDGIKRLYNEDITNPSSAVQEGATPTVGILTASAGGGGAAGRVICNLRLSQQEDGSTPCPPLQPVSAT